MNTLGTGTSDTESADRSGTSVGEFRARLLVVDDETPQMRALCETLRLEGYSVQGFTSPREALASLKPGQYDLMLTDLMMPGMNGISLIAAAKDIDPAMGCIVMTGQGSIDSAVQAMRSGALDYILKPFQLNVILTVITRALDLQWLKREHAALQEQERRRSEELATAYRDLEAFSYSVSHDLRAPLVFMKGFAGTLDDEYSAQLGEKGREMVQVIRSGAQSMDDMIVGLLAFAKANRQKLRLVMLDMTTIVRTVVQELLATHEGTAPEVVIGNLPSAAADASVIRNVWSNLIGNAIKYSNGRKDARVRIDGRIENGEAVFGVEDNGVGFDMRQADKLFGVFRRLHSSKDFPGTGVGLAIAHRIVTRHGGRMNAWSEPEVGSRFEFTLPATVPAAAT